MKKDETRFTIRFNPADPRHQKAVGVLIAAGRRKASLIADAVCEYAARHGADGVAVTLTQTTQEKMVEKISAIVTAPISHSAGKADNQDMGGVNTDKNHAEADLAAETPIGDDMRQAILDGLSMFTSAEGP
jgi:hypothetical protein